MIDLQKTNNSYLNKSVLLSHPKLDFKSPMSHDTGEVFDNYSTKCDNLVFVIKKNYIYIKGSIHTLHNMLHGKGEQNYNNFTYDQLQYMLQYLANTFGIDLSRARIENLEYGVNIEVPIPSEQIVKDHLIFFDGQSAYRDYEYCGKGQFKEWEFSEYLIKVYAKSLQYKLDEHILRFEKKKKTNRELAKFGITHLIHLLDKDKLLALRDDLIQTFDNTLIVDHLSSKRITNLKDKQVFENGINTIFWKRYQLKKQDSETKKEWQKLQAKTRMAKKRFKDKFENVLNKYELDTLKSLIRERIYNKWNELLCYNITAPVQMPDTKPNVTRSPLAIVCNRNTLKNQKNKQASKRTRNIQELCLRVDAKNADGTLRLYTKLHHDYYFIKRERNQMSNKYHNRLNNFVVKLQRRVHQSMQGSLFPISTQLSFTANEMAILEQIKERGKDSALLAAIGY